MITMLELKTLKQQFGIRETFELDKDEQDRIARNVKEGLPLPEDISSYEFENKTCYCRVAHTELSNEQLQEYLTLKALSEYQTINETLLTIKHIAVFFCTLTVISLVVGVIWALSIR